MSKCKTAAISQLQDMFPGESNNTLQQTLQASVNMEDAVDKLLNSGNLSLKHSLCIKLSITFDIVFTILQFDINE